PGRRRGQRDEGDEADRRMAPHAGTPSMTHTGVVVGTTFVSSNPALPKGGDAYLLSHIIHDWNEAQCLTILGHCRRAMSPAGRLLLVEMVLPEGDAPHFGKMLDLMMLVGPGGQERTEKEYVALF